METEKQTVYDWSSGVLTIYEVEVEKLAKKEPSEIAETPSFMKFDK
jgi:hypothetical protein